MFKRFEVKYTHQPQRILQTLLTALLLAPLAAQAAEQAGPGAGAILQQMLPPKPMAALPAGTGLMIEQGRASTLPPSAPFLVTRIRILGNTLFDTSTLHALLADAEGKSFTLAELGQQVARITEYYQRHDHPLARAFIPAQTIREGEVTVEVIEARYGVISLDNSSRASAALLRATLGTLQGGQAVTQTEMDHALLLLSDIPGISIHAVLKPGAGVATSDLLVKATPAATVTGNLALDNDGNRHTGRARIGGAINVFNPLRHGDILGFSGLGSGRGMNYGRVSYETLLNGRGTRLGGSWSALRYVLGAPLAALDAHGTARVASLWARHPLLRSPNLNLYGQIQHDALQLQDHVDASALRTDRHLANWTVSLAGDVRDALLAGAVSTWNVSWAKGRTGFDDALAHSADAATARTGGGFAKWNANLVRQQSLAPDTGLCLSATGQWANGNLDASQKISVGGPYTVRAYDMGALAGDSGYLASAELRRDLGMGMPWGGQWQAVAFIDSAHVTVNRNAWAAGTNGATLSGAGLGLNWSGAQWWSARAHVATPIGAVPVLVAHTTSTRVWVDFSRRF